MKTRIALFLVAVLLLAACGSDGQSSGEPLGDGPYPVATLSVTITHPDAIDASYTISCLGDTATIVGNGDIDADEACTNLADEDVRDRLVDGAPPDQICTEIYGGPDEAFFVGTYEGETIGTTIDRVNGCGIDDWDILLDGILPPALGLAEGSY
jgi:hypothetical protein